MLLRHATCNCDRNIVPIFKIVVTKFQAAKFRALPYSGSGNGPQPSTAAAIAAATAAIYYIATKEARRRRRDRCGRLGGRSGRHPRHRARPPPLPRRPRQRAVRVQRLARRRAHPGPARTAARAGAPQIHQVLLLDLQWGANCRPARRDARGGGGR